MLAFLPRPAVAWSSVADLTTQPGNGFKNYITPGGLQRLRDELRFLLTRERPAVTQVVAWAAGNGQRSENADYPYNKRRLRQIDPRIHFLLDIGREFQQRHRADNSLMGDV